MLATTCSELNMQKHNWTE